MSAPVVRLRPGIRKGRESEVLPADRWVIVGEEPSPVGEKWEIQPLLAWAEMRSAALT